MFKFIHCADLHLDSPLQGLHSREDAPVDEIRGATRRALENLVRLCIEEAVDFLVIAGDVYDGEWTDYSTGLFFSSCMARLNQHHIPVYLIRGNHDAASIISRKLVLPGNVTEFPTNEPRTHRLDSIQVAIHGQGFATREVRENLAITYPDAVPGYFNIGLLHTSVEGQADHETYAPCNLSDLTSKGYDYWALGHIHKRQILHEQPYVVFPGNLQGRHIRETGDKGCTLVTVEGGNAVLEHRSLDVLRWCLCDVDLTGATADVDISGRVEAALGELIANHPGYPLAVRVRLLGQTDLHAMLVEHADDRLAIVQNAAVMTAPDLIWIEKVQVDTHPLTTIKMDSSHASDALAMLEAAVTSALSDDEFVGEFLAQTAAIQARLGPYLKRQDAARIRSVEDIQPLLEDAKSILFSHLGKGTL